MWSGFQAKKLNACRKLELWNSDSENLAGLVPGPDSDQEPNFNFFKKSNPQLCPFATWKDSLILQHKSKKGCFKIYTNHETPCTSKTSQRQSPMFEGFCLVPDFFHVHFTIPLSTGKAKLPKINQNLWEFLGANQLKVSTISDQRDQKISHALLPWISATGLLVPDLVFRPRRPS